MKISKYLHSCLLFEQDGYKLLIDPGKFTFAEGLVRAEQFADVNSIIITHIHADHLDTENLSLIAKLSGASILANKQVGEKLTEANIPFELLCNGIQQLGPFKLEAFTVVHELIMDNPLPQMTGLLINDKVLNPVDSLNEELLRFKGVELLLMVTMAPFTTEPRIAAFADKLQPKQILPVHDGYAKEFFIKQRYEAYTKHFDKQGIKFHNIYQPGDGISI
jgi:L-ascorbate metabolism protein UlaG (beta-lactamase superfamily)